MIPAPYMPKRHKRPADWKPPLSEHEAWIDELVYGPRYTKRYFVTLTATAVVCILAAVCLLYLTP